MTSLEQHRAPNWTAEGLMTLVEVERRLGERRQITWSPEFIKIERRRADRRLRAEGRHVKIKDSVCYETQKAAAQ